MAYCRLIFIFFLIFAGNFHASAQKYPAFYIGLDLYRQTDFKNNTFGNFNIGSQLFHWKIFAPEIGFEHYSGTLEEDNINIEGSGSPFYDGVFRKRFSGNFLSLNPKLKFGKNDAYLYISPKYHIGKVIAKGRYFELDESEAAYKLRESQKMSAPIWFWSFSIGFEGLAITDKYWFALFLNYTEISANDAFSLLDFSEQDIKTTGINTTTIGFGIRFYYNPFPSEND